MHPTFIRKWRVNNMISIWLHTAIYFQVLDSDINRFGTAFICLYDTPRWKKSEANNDTILCSWNLSQNCTRVTGEDLSLRFDPNSTVFLTKRITYKTCNFLSNDKFVAVPRFSDSTVQFIESEIHVPTLKHFCRFTIRSRVPETQKVMSLPLPHVLLSYLTYEWMNKIFPFRNLIRIKGQYLCTIHICTRIFV